MSKEITHHQKELEKRLITRTLDFRLQKDAFDANLKEISATSADWVPLIPGLKGMPRALEKSAQKLEKTEEETLSLGISFDPQSEYQNQINRMSDILRGSFVVDDKADVQSAIETTLDRFIPGWKEISNEDGVVTYQGDNG